MTDLPSITDITAAMSKYKSNKAAGAIIKVLAVVILKRVAPVLSHYILCI